MEGIGRGWKGCMRTAGVVKEYVQCAVRSRQCALWEFGRGRQREWERTKGARGRGKNNRQPEQRAAGKERKTEGSGNGSGSGHGKQRKERQSREQRAESRQPVADAAQDPGGAGRRAQDTREAQDVSVRAAGGALDGCQLSESCIGGYAQ